MTRIKLAELTSGVGALVLGLGLGTLLAGWLQPAAVPATVIGLGMHGFGMWDKHRLEARAGMPPAGWVTGLYWACWLLWRPCWGGLSRGPLDPLRTRTDTGLS